jgi:hypothetical protein
MGPVAPRMSQPDRPTSPTLGPGNNVVDIQVLNARPHRLPTPRTPRPRHQGRQQRLTLLLVPPSEAPLGGRPRVLATHGWFPPISAENRWREKLTGGRSGAETEGKKSALRSFCLVLTPDPRRRSSLSVRFTRFGVLWESCLLTTPIRPCWDSCLRRSLLRMTLHRRAILLAAVWWPAGPHPGLPVGYPAAGPGTRSA